MLTLSIAVYSPPRPSRVLFGSSLSPSAHPQTSRPEAEVALYSTVEWNNIPLLWSNYLHAPHISVSAPPLHWKARRRLHQRPVSVHHLAWSEVREAPLEIGLLSPRRREVKLLMVGLVIILMLLLLKRKIITGYHPLILRDKTHFTITPLFHLVMGINRKL